MIVNIRERHCHMSNSAHPINGFFSTLLNLRPRRVLSRTDSVSHVVLKEQIKEGISLALAGQYVQRKLNL